MKNKGKKGTFDFSNPQFTSLYHKNSSNRTDFLVPKTILLEESLYMKTLPKLQISFWDKISWILFWDILWKLLG